MKNSKRLVVLASGEGSTFRGIAEAAQSGQLPAQVVGLAVSRAGIGALENARQLQVPYQIFNPHDFQSRDEWDQGLTEQVEAWRPDLIALAGFTQLLGERFLKRFEGRVVNTHPSLLPKYGGQGMYGLRVHQAVVAAKEKESGITVHHVTAKYDAGPIVAQKSLLLAENETAESLAGRLKQIEKEFYISVLARLLS
ncbi:MAG: phosphoribosylglycinamide formyltransferase [Bdellovibrionales bacterium]